MALSLVITPMSDTDRQMRIAMGLCSAMLVALGVPVVMTGIGLRRFKPWSRIPALGYCVIALLAAPIGTIFGVIFFMVLSSESAKYLYSNRPSPPTEAP